MRLTDWRDSNKEIGQAVRQILDGKHRKAAKKIVQLTERARNIVKFLEGQPVSEWEM